MGHVYRGRAADGETQTGRTEVRLRYEVDMPSAANQSLLDETGEPSRRWTSELAVKLGLTYRF